MQANMSIRRALLVAGLFLLVAVGLKVLARRYLSAEIVDRLFGILLGALVMVYANAVPKILMPLARLECDPAREQALRRFAGWALVLGGLGYGLASAVAPASIENHLSVALLGTAVVLVLGRCLWSRRQHA